MCLFEYDEKREKELIRKAEFQETTSECYKHFNYFNKSTVPKKSHTKPDYLLKQCLKY